MWCIGVETGARTVGAVRVAIMCGTTTIRSVHAAPGRRDRLVARLLDRVRQHRPVLPTELLVCPARVTGPLAPALPGCGFELVLEQLHYSGNLRALAPRAEPAGPACREPAPGELIPALERVWADGDTPGGRAPAEAVDALLVHAATPAGRTDDALWRLAFQDDELVGVVLPQVLRDPGGTGVVRYLGVVPAARGRGVGGALYAKGLWLLRGAGGRRYDDATGSGNHAMLRLFERAGCVPAGDSRLYRAPPLEPPPERLGELDEMIAHLAARGHAAALTPTGGCLRLLARRGSARVEIHVRPDSHRRRLWLEAGGLVESIAFPTGKGVRPGDLDRAVSSLLTDATRRGVRGWAPLRLLEAPMQRQEETSSWK